MLGDKQACVVKAESFASEAEAAKPMVALAKDFCAGKVLVGDL